MNCQKRTSERRNLWLFLVQKHRCDSRIQSKPYSYRVQRVYNSGQIIATSYDLTPKGSKRREISLLSGKSRLVKYCTFPTGQPVQPPTALPRPTQEVAQHQAVAGYPRGASHGGAPHRQVPTTSNGLETRGGNRDLGVPNFTNLVV